MKRAVSFLLLLWCVWLPAAESLPPKPERYFNDYAGVVSPAAAGNFNRKLEQFERDTSSQIVVAIYPKFPSASSLEDFANRLFTAWEIGQKNRNNGALLLVFIQDRRMRIEVGYGLEGALPDAICKRIIAEQIAPQFRNQNYTAGIGAGIDAMLAATRGEYTGTGRTAGRVQQNPPSKFLIFGLLGLFLFLMIITRGRILWWILQAMVFNGRSYSSRGSSWSSGGSWGGGGFSGGGGRSGGGGASGSW